MAKWWVKYRYCRSLLETSLGKPLHRLQTVFVQREELLRYRRPLSRTSSVCRKCRRVFVVLFCCLLWFFCACFPTAACWFNSLPCWADRKLISGISIALKIFYLVSETIVVGVIQFQGIISDASKFLGLISDCSKFLGKTCDISRSQRTFILRHINSVPVDIHQFRSLPENICWHWEVAGNIREHFGRSEMFLICSAK